VLFDMKNCMSIEHNHKLININIYLYFIVQSIIILKVTLVMHYCCWK